MGTASTQGSRSVRLRPVLEASSCDAERRSCTSMLAAMRKGTPAHAYGTRWVLKGLPSNSRVVRRCRRSHMRMVPSSDTVSSWCSIQGLKREMLHESVWPSRLHRSSTAPIACAATKRAGYAQIVLGTRWSTSPTRPDSWQEASTSPSQEESCDGLAAMLARSDCLKTTTPHRRPTPDGCRAWLQLPVAASSAASAARHDRCSRALPTRRAHTRSSHAGCPVWGSGPQSGRPAPSLQRENREIHPPKARLSALRVRGTRQTP